MVLLVTVVILFTINVYSAAFFDILENRFETLCEFDQVIDKNISFNELEDLYFKKLANCIREHELLTQYVNKFDSVYKNITFVQIFSSVMQICFAEFQILLVRKNDRLFKKMFILHFVWNILISGWFFSKIDP